MKRWRLALSSADEAAETAPILLRGDLGENLLCAAQLGYDALEVHTRETAVWDYEEIEKVDAGI